MSIGLKPGWSNLIMILLELSFALLSYHITWKVLYRFPRRYRGENGDWKPRKISFSVQGSTIHFAMHLVYVSTVELETNCRYALKLVLELQDW